jgi:Peptidase M50B-like
MAALPLEEMVQRIGEKQPPLPAASALGIGLACLLVVMFPVTWMFVRYFSTMAHEGSHGVMGSLSGGKVTGIWLRSKDANGETKSQGIQGKGVPFLFVGYVGPSAFGLAAAKLISIGHSVAVLWLALALLLLLLAFVRNIFGIAAIVIAGYVIYVFARYGSVSHETMAAYGIAWLLLLGGVRSVLKHWDGAYDAGELGKRTDIRPVVFARFWLVGTLFALFLGTRLMM